MGNYYENMESYELFQCEPCIPIYFFPKIKEEKKDEKNKDTNHSKKKFLNIFELETNSRKSTLDEEDIGKEKLPKGANIKKAKEKENKFQNIFKNFPSLENKNDADHFDEDNYYLNFNENDNMRKNYFSKLICKNIWTLDNKPKTHNNLFIFDWDNTLLPTNFMSQEEIIDDEYLPEKYEEIFSILEKAIINVIKFCINKGDVYIITNSSIGWVEFSTNKFYPNLKKYIEKIGIISARSLYENTYPGNLKAWKEKAFLNLKNKINLKIPSNIICFGDSIVELEAGKKLASKINNSFIKTIKFKENPDPEDLIRQLNSIADMLDYIYSTVKNFSITIDKKDKYDFKNLCII